MKNAPLETGKTAGKRNAYPFYSPRFWHGMRVGPWWRLLRENRFRVHPLRLGLAITVTSTSFANSALAAVQNLIYGRRLENVTLQQPPLFVIGHWRSGTTLLHELLSLDDRFTSPTTYECFAPEHFVVSGKIFPKLLWFLLPGKRPMDDVPIGFDRPQEDEIALCTMGAPTPMRRLAFPNHPPPYMDFLDMEEAGPEDLERWRHALQGFLRSVAYLRPNQRLVLKSPPHTGRLALLWQMFPGAQFIHISRDPRALYASTVRLWKALDDAQGLQVPRHEGLEEYVFAACERMYRGYVRQRPQIPAGSICELRYEDLVAEPARELRRIYQSLALGDFDHVQPHVEEYLRGRREYRAGRYQLPADLEEKVRRRWAFYFEMFGYSEEKVES